MTGYGKATVTFGEKKIHVELKSLNSKVLTSFNNSLINNTVFHLLNFEKHSSFPDAVREAAINNDFQLFILSEDFNPVLAIETRPA